jgi:hypothetical protein
MYGISDYKYPTQCTPETACMQMDERDEFNCTGSNICVFYPADRYLQLCQDLQSNLTQIHITCVNIAHLKKYFIQKNKKWDQKEFELKIKQQMPSQLPVNMWPTSSSNANESPNNEMTASNMEQESSASLSGNKKANMNSIKPNYTTTNAILKNNSDNRLNSIILEQSTSSICLVFFISIFLSTNRISML